MRRKEADRRAEATRSGRARKGWSAATVISHADPNTAAATRPARQSCPSSNDLRPGQHGQELPELAGPLPK